MTQRLPSPNPNRSAPRGRGFGRDDRAVSPLLGAILLFALVLALLVLIQVTAVPGWNQQVEYEHNQRVQQDMRGLEAGIEDAGQLDSPSSAVVETGIEYPSRPFLFNPPDPSGTIETDGAGEVKFTNANVTGVDTVWTDGTQSYTTQGFQYVPDYNEYANFPVTRFENGVLYNQYDGTLIPLSDSGLVQGRTITVVTLDGQLSSAPGTSGTVALEPLAGRARPVSIQSHDGSDIVIEFPTRLDEEAWTAILATEIQANNPNGYVTGLSVNGGVLELQLQGTDADGPIQYQLRLGKVGIDGDGEFEGAHYLTLDTGDSLTLTEGTTTTITAEVRNRYNNPVRGELVTFELADGPGSFLDATGTTATVTTGPDGTASIRYRAGASAATINVSGDLDGSGTVDPRERATVLVDGQRFTGGDDDGGLDTLNPVGALDVRLTDYSFDSVGCETPGSGGSKPNCRILMQLYNSDSVNASRIDEARINLFIYTQSPGTGAPDNATFQNASERMEVRGSYAELDDVSLMNRTIAPEDYLNVSVRFYEGGDPVNVGPSANRYLVGISVLYENGRVANYLLANDVPTTKGPKNNN